MTEETLRRTRNGLELVSIRIIEPLGIPFNPDGFIDLAIKSIEKELAEEKRDEHEA